MVNLYHKSICSTQLVKKARINATSLNPCKVISEYEKYFYLYIFYTNHQIMKNVTIYSKLAEKQEKHGHMNE